MEESGDFTMGEDVVMRSTELNGGESYDHTVYRADGAPLPGENSKPQMPLSSDALAPLSPVKPDADMQVEDAEMSGSNGSSDNSTSVEESPYDEEAYTPRPYPPVQVEALQPKAKFLPYASRRSGLIYDVRMRYHTEPISAGEDEFHPEDPRRIYAIYTRLKEGGLVEDEQDKNSSAALDANFKLHLIPTRQAKKSEICLVHTEEHYEWVKALYSKLVRFVVSDTNTLIFEKAKPKMSYRNRPREWTLYIYIP